MDLLDALTIQKILLIAAVGGLLGLDRTALGQFMVSEPIVAAPLIGWLLGDTAAGIVIGVVLEMLWVLDLPVGTFVPADSTIAATAATAIAVLGSRGDPALPGVMGFSLLLTTGIAPVTMLADRFIRHQNARLAVWALDAGDTDIDRRLATAHLAGLLVFFLKSFVMLLVLVPVGLGAVQVYNAMPGKFHAAMALFVRLLLFLGAALVIRKLSRDVVDRSVLFGAVSSIIGTLALNVHPGIAVSIAALAGWLGVRYGER
ncbi:MAG TPA: PTS sugar transporter subunit IIC [Nitrospirota bacterium]|nr:PTS sugar transporter subunit IIC [Nitrospirota bacterium]